MVEAAPTSPFVLAKSDLLLEILVTPFNPPAQLGGVDQRAAADLGRQSGQPVFCWLGFIRRPLDRTPSFISCLRTFVIAMCPTHPHSCEA